MEATIHSCPFCNGAPKLVVTHGAVCVRCTQCDAQGPWAFKSQEPFETEHYAIDRWNRRGGIGGSIRVALLDPRVPAETYKYTERLRSVVDKIESGNMGAPDRGALLSMEGKVLTVTELRLGHLELNGIIAALVSTLHAQERTIKA